MLIISMVIHSDRKHSAGFILAAFTTTKVTASKEIARTINTARTNTPIFTEVR